MYDSKGFLLDTHVLIWMLNSPELLSDEVRQILIDPDSQLFYSKVSLWEIAIKISIKKLELVDNWLAILETEFENKNIHVLEMDWACFPIIQDLPFHHRDPFDRMFIVQAMIHHLSLLSADGHFKQYDVNVIW